MSDSRAVSEVVGYVIILGLVFSSIGLVYLNAVPAMQGSQEFEQMRNTERSFSVLDGNFDEMIEKDVPRRATEMRMLNARVRVGDEEHGNITINHTNSGLSVSNSYDTIKYETDEEQIIYELGAIIASSGSGSAMISEPNWFMRDNHLFISLKITKSGDLTSRTGTGVVLIRSSQKAKNIYLRDSVANTPIEIEINTDNPGAWENFFEGHDEIRFDSVTVTDQKVTAEIDHGPVNNFILLESRTINNLG